jgi:hypothetical protein
MSTGTARPAVELAPPASARPKLALALALISVLGVTIGWDVGAAMGWAGVAVAIAAIVIGLQARSRLQGRGRVMASAAVVVASLAALSVIVFLITGALD